MNLLTTFSEEENREMRYLIGDDLKIFSSFNNDCYILNEYGELTYEQCFGIVENLQLKSQRFEKVIPRRMFRYFNFFFMEETLEKGHWFVGYQQKNNAILFLAGHSNLGDAIDSI